MQRSVGGYAGPASDSHPQQESKLLMLPPELRNRIVHYALVKPERVFVPALTAKRCRIIDGSVAKRRVVTNKDLLSEPALLSTCRQLREEGTPVYYDGNVFYSFDIDALVQWLQCIAHTKRDFVKNLACDGESMPFSTPAHALVQLSMFDKKCAVAKVHAVNATLRLRVKTQAGLDWLTQREVAMRMTDEDFREHRKRLFEFSSYANQSWIACDICRFHFTDMYMFKFDRELERMGPPYDSTTPPGSPLR